MNKHRTIIHLKESEIMDLPIYKEVHLPKGNREVIWSSLEKIQWGAIPLVINIKPHEVDSQRMILDAIQDFLDERQISPYLPYPTFLLTNVKTDGNYPIKTFLKDEQLPKYFKQKMKRPHLKEIEVLEKISLQLQKIEHVDFTMLKDKIAEYAHGHKIIYDQGQENTYYEKLLQKLRNRKNETRK